MGWKQAGIQKQSGLRGLEREEDMWLLEDLLLERGMWSPGQADLPKGARRESLHEVLTATERDRMFLFCSKGMAAILGGGRFGI